MRFPIALRGAAAGAVMTALAVAAPLALQGDRITNDKDLKKVAGKLGDWLTALDEGEDYLEPEADFREELTKLNDKKLKGTDLLSSPADAGQLIYLANQYDRKAPKRANGKVLDKTVDAGGRGNTEYSVWTPPKYKPKEGPYALVITIPDEGVKPDEHITSHWTDQALKDTTILAAPKMPGNADDWDDIPGLAAVMLTLRDVTSVYAYDATRTFIGGRGRGGEAALAIANMFPDRFAGAFCWSGDGGEGVTVDNVRNLPIWISAGGSKSTALEKAAKDAGFDNITLAPGGAVTDLAAWMSDKVRAAFPDKVSIVPGERFPTGAYWVEFDPTAGEDVRLDAEVNRETNTITLTGNGVTRARVYFSDGLVDMSQPVTVVANGESVTEKFDRSANVFLEQLKSGRNDAGRVFVWAQSYHLPALDGESDG